MNRIMVLGLGNPLMGDDGVGVVALAELERHFQVPDEVERLDGGVLGLQLLGRVEGVDTLLVLDAVSAGLPAGSVMRLQLDQIQRVLSNKLSMHQVGFREVLATSGLRGARVPELLVIGVQPENVDPHLGLSEPVAASLRAVVELVARELTDLGVDITRRAEPLPAAKWEAVLSA